MTPYLSYQKILKMKHPHFQVAIIFEGKMTFPT